MFKIIFPEKPCPKKMELAGLWLPFLERLDGRPNFCLTTEGFDVHTNGCYVSFSEPEKACVVIGDKAEEMARILAVSWGAFCARNPETVEVENWPELETSFSGTAFDRVTSAAFMMDMLRHLRFDSEFLAFFDNDVKSVAQFADFFVECRYREGMEIRACGPDESKVKQAVSTIENIGEMIYDTKPVRNGKDLPGPKLA